MEKKYKITGITYSSIEDIADEKETNSLIIARLIIFLFQLKHDVVEIEIKE